MITLVGGGGRVLTPSTNRATEAAIGFYCKILAATAITMAVTPVLEEVEAVGA